MSSSAAEPVTNDATSNLPRLSLDIIQMVLDEIGASDKRTQADCSLVCSSWMSLARRYLFHDVKIWLSGTGETLSDFLTFLDISPRVCMHIRDLSFSYRPDKWAPHHYGPVDGLLLLLVVSALPRLRSLSLQTVQLSNTVIITDLIFEHPLLLDALELSDIVCSDAPGVGDIANILGVFTSIDYVYLSAIEPNFDNYMNPPSAPSGNGSFAEIHNLELGDSRHGVPTNVWLVAMAPSLPQLTSLDVFCHTLQDVTALRYTMSTASETLLSVSIKLCEAQGVEGLAFDGMGCPPRVEVSDAICTGLKSSYKIERFEIQACITVDNPGDDWTMLTTILARLPKSVQELVFTVFIEDTEWEHRKFINSFSAGFQIFLSTCKKFTRLKSLYFSVGSSEFSMQDDDRERIYKKLEEFCESAEGFYPATFSSDDQQWKPVYLPDLWPSKINSYASEGLDIFAPKHPT